MKKFLSVLENRADLSLIAEWIEAGSSVLDLGCGDGRLLYYLIKNKKVSGMGIEIDPQRMVSCIEKGIPVIEHDLNEKFEELGDQTYDYVILSQTIQEVLHPDLLIEEILRVGKYGIITFPNFGYYRVRLSLLFSGKMPKSKTLPYEWYDTPNIHLLTFEDFKNFCKKRGIKIIHTFYIIGNHYKKRPFFPNLFSEGCAVLISR
jgi:methionine biosynthesis protein MetW